MDSDFPMRQQVRDQIDHANYMVLSTISGDEPHTTPVFFAEGRYLTFYWLSATDAQHSKNIEASKKVSAVIFDSSVPQGTGIALYFKGRAERVRMNDEVFPEGNERLYALKLLCKKGSTLDFNELSKPGCPRQVYKVQIHEAWLNGAVQKDGVWVDEKMEWPIHAQDSRYTLKRDPDPVYA